MKYKFLFLPILFLLGLVSPAMAQVSVTFNAPTYGFNVLPGSVWTFNVGITNGTGNLVNWTVSSTAGGATATLSASTNAVPIVTATFGATGATCAIAGAMGSYSVTSAATVTIQAQSVDDVSKTASTTIKVCNPAVQIAVVPFYNALYVNQIADLQSFIVGSTNLNVTWSLGSCDGTAVGQLLDTSNRDTVFTGTGKGRCTVTATSSADGSKTANATLYVNGLALPVVGPNQTEPVDCTIDPDATGTDYEVGPARAFTTIQSVPLNTAPAGSTVRIHNDGTLGSPTTYFEYFQVSSQNATATQPIRVCGVPASNGELPVLDANNATGASWVSSVSAAGLGLASLAGPAFGHYQLGNPGNANIEISGLHFKNTRPGFTYTTPGGTPGTAWQSGASGINVRHGFNMVFRGNDFDNCSNGLFTDNNMNNNSWLGNAMWMEVEGNHIHGSGETGSFLSHSLYEQAWGVLTQFNRVDNYLSTADGVNLKSRSIMDVVRYNWIDMGPPGGSGTRQIDMVELQDSSAYEDFEVYLGAPGDVTCADSFWCSGDTMGPNILAAWQEAYRHTFFYGNGVQTGASAEDAFHFGEDHDGGMSNRLGVLHFYNNTWNMIGPFRPTDIVIQDLFDTSGGGGNAYNNNEFPQVQIWNNIVWTPPGTGSTPYWNHLATFIGDFRTNLLMTAWGSIATPINGGNINAQTGNGWANGVTQFSYPLAVPLDGHMTGISAGNFLTTGTQPFDSATYAPPSGSAAINAGTALSGAMAVMPVRFQFNPTTNTITTRTHTATLGAFDSSPSPLGSSVPANVTLLGVSVH